MAVKENLTSAAGQVAGLRNSVAALRERLSITVDAQGLRDDITRLADDLDLVARSAGVGSNDRSAPPARSSSFLTRTTTRRGGLTPTTRAVDLAPER